MTLPIQYPLINGVRHDFSSLELKFATFGNLVIVGIKSVNYKSSLKPTKVYGTHPQPIGRTRGVYDASGDIEMYLAEANVLESAIAATGQGLMEAVFDATVTRFENQFDSIIDEIIGCRITDRDSSNSQGGDAATIKYTLDVMVITLNKNNSLTNPLTGV